MGKQYHFVFVRLSEEETSTWEMVKGDQPDIPVDVEVDSSKLPVTTDENGEQVLQMYWIDAYEDQYKQPGMGPSLYAVVPTF